MANASTAATPARATAAKTLSPIGETQAVYHACAMELHITEQQRQQARKDAAARSAGHDHCRKPHEDRGAAGNWISDFYGALGEILTRDALLQAGYALTAPALVENHAPQEADFTLNGNRFDVKACPPKEPGRPQFIGVNAKQHEASKCEFYIPVVFASDELARVYAPIPHEDVSQWKLMRNGHSPYLSCAVSTLKPLHDWRELAEAGNRANTSIAYTYDTEQGFVFFHHLRGEPSTACLELRAFAADGDVKRRWFRHNDDTSGWIKSMLAEQRNIYVGIATRAFGKGNGDGLQFTNLLWVEIDLKNTVGGEAEITRRLNSYPRRPFLVIHSGGGLHVYWKIERFDLTTEANRKHLKSVLTQLIADTGASVESKDAPRVLRVPGTWNFKAEYGDPRAVKFHMDNGIETDNGAIYRMEDFPLPVVDPKPAPAVREYRPHSPEDSKPTEDVLLHRALNERNIKGSRHKGGVWLATQLRDNGYTESEGERVMMDYQQQADSGEHPYTAEEAGKTLHGIYQRPARDPWRKRNASPNPAQASGDTPKVAAAATFEARFSGFSDAQIQAIRTLTQWEKWGETIHQRKNDTDEAWRKEATEWFCFGSFDYGTKEQTCKRLYGDLFHRIKRMATAFRAFGCKWEPGIPVWVHERLQGQTEEKRQEVIAEYRRRGRMGKDAIAAMLGTKPEPRIKKGWPKVGVYLGDEVAAEISDTLDVVDPVKVGRAIIAAMRYLKDANSSHQAKEQSEESGNLFAQETSDSTSSDSSDIYANSEPGLDSAKAEHEPGARFEEAAEDTELEEADVCADAPETRCMVTYDADEADPFAEEAQEVEASPDPFAPLEPFADVIAWAEHRQARRGRLEPTEPAQKVLNAVANFRTFAASPNPPDGVLASMLDKLRQQQEQSELQQVAS